MTWLGLDLGTSSVKALVVSDEGMVLASATESYPTLQPEAGASEQDPADWLRATVRAVQGLGEHRSSIQAIGLSGQMHGTVCLGVDHHVLHPAIIWSDVRGAAALERLNTAIGHEAIVDEIGSPLATGFQAVTLAWLRDAKPEVWNGIRTVLLPKDWLRLQLTGELQSEPSDGASTGLQAVRTRDWSPKMIGWIEADDSWFAPVQASNVSAGSLLPTLAAEMGLLEAIPVVAGGGDAPLAALATGIASRDAVLLTLSSGAQVTRFATTPLVDAAGRMHTFGSPLNPEIGEPGWYLMGATMVAGSALHWLRDAVLETSQSIPDLLAAAESVPAGSDGLIFLPYLAGERTPLMDPLARGAFFGLTADHTWRHMVRAIVEGAVFALRDALDLVEAVSGPAGDVVVAGGALRSPVWQQSVSAIVGRPVTPSRVVDQSAMGAAVLAASGLTGVPASTIATAWSAFDDPIVPDPRAIDRMAELRIIYATLYDRHREQFPTLAPTFGMVSD